jgi:hypothetical protein
MYLTTAGDMTGLLGLLRPVLGHHRERINTDGIAF